MNSVEDMSFNTKARVIGIQPINVTTTKQAVDETIRACQRKGVRCILPMGMDTWGIVQFKDMLFKHYGERVKIITTNTFFEKREFDPSLIKEAREQAKRAYLQSMYNPHNLCCITHSMFTVDDIMPYTKFPFLVIMFVPPSLKQAIHMSKHDHDVEYIVEMYKRFMEPKLLTDALQKKKFPQLETLIKICVQ
jgi:ubiquinone/menaquinone biosynthesis C-methylase UbiE